LDFKFLSLSNINSKITILIAKIVYINRIVIVNICFNSNNTFSNNEIFGIISYSSEKVSTTDGIYGIGGGSNNLIFGFTIHNEGDIRSGFYPNPIKATQYANINSVYYTNKKL